MNPETEYQYLERTIREALSRDLYESIDSPKNLWQKQERVQQYINDNKEHFSEEQTRTLEQLCKDARKKVATIPDGDEWMEYWK